MSVVDALVHLQGISKSYMLGRTRVHALNNLDFSLAKGAFTALVGASGSGKSTLLNMIGCIDRPDSGEVRVAGSSLGGLSEQQRAALRNRHIGFVFQSFNLIPVLSVLENTQMPLLIDQRTSRKERRDRALAVLDEVGMSAFAGQRPDQLSGGQRQRVAIARALVAEPSLVLADEPTANLDSDTTTKILDMMLELNSKRRVTFLICTHDEKLISRVSKVVRIKDGKVDDVQ